MIDLSDNAADQSSLEPVPAAQPQRVRVGWVASAGSMEKLVRILKPLCIGLMDELVDVTVFCPQDAPAADQLPAPPIEVFRYPPPGWLGYQQRRLEPTAAVLKSRKLDLLHALDAEAVPVTARLSGMCGLEYVASCYGLDDARRLGSLDRLARVLLAASEPVRRSLVDGRVTAPERVRLLRPGVYHVEEATCFTDPQFSVTVVADGPFNSMAPWDTVLRAMFSLKGRYGDCAFFCLGGGPAESRIRHLAYRLGLGGDITFAIRQPTTQLAGILKAADIYISPCPGPEFDVPSLLAVAAGTPVVCAPGGAGDFLVPGVTTLSYDPGDAAELSQSLIGLVEDRPSAMALANRALDHLRANHGPAAMVSAMAAVYRQAAAGRFPR
jgi:glycosyltransferase involved in cell wall biosynthesis